MSFPFALRRLLLPLALFVCPLAPALALATGVARAEGTAAVIHFQPESLAALEAQLHHREVHAVTFHPTPAPGHVHVSMTDGRHFTVIYAAGEQEKLLALARAGGARYVVAKAKAAPAKGTHHKLRYIVGGILVVVILIVLCVLLIDRRRKLREGASVGGASDAAGAGSSGGAGAQAAGGAPGGGDPST